MIFNVTVKKENGETTESFQYKAKVYRNKGLTERSKKWLKVLVSSISQAYEQKPDVTGIYLMIPIFCFLSGIFKQDASYLSLLVLLVSVILAFVSFHQNFTPDKNSEFLIATYLLITVAHYISPISPLSLSYTFPLLSVYRSLAAPCKQASFSIFSALLLPHILFSQDCSSLLFSIFLSYFFLYKNNFLKSNRGSRINEIYQSPRPSASQVTIAPYMHILNSLNRSLELLKDSVQSESIKESIEILEKSLKTMKKSQNIYSLKIKNITKNLDIEDKIFLEQNTLPSKIEAFCKTPVVFDPRELVYGVNELAGILKRMGKDWNFNIFLVSNCTNNTPLYTCGEYVFQYFNFYKLFKIDLSCAKNFLQRVESKYRGNPYHNSCHAADVMISFMFLLSSVIPNIPSVEFFASIIACLGHDIEHPGRNNRFLIHTKNELALHYNDISVLENMHAKEIFEVINSKDCNILTGVADYWIVRKVIIDLILSTDMAKHFEFIAGQKDIEKNIKAKLENFNERLEVYKLGIKSADIAHTSKCLDIHKQWCKLLTEEFFSQGDREKELGLNVSMYCDRNNTDIHKSQAGFLKNIAMPLFVSLYQSIQCESIDLVCIQEMKRNLLYWEKRKDNGRYSTFSASFFSDRLEFRRTTLPKAVR